MKYALNLTHIFFAFKKTNSMILLIFSIIFLVVPIVANLRISYEKQNNTLYLQLKIFFIINLANIKVDLNNKQIEIYTIKKKLIKFDEIKFSKPKNTWIIKAIRGITSIINVDIDLIEYSKYVKGISALCAVLYMAEVGLKNYFTNTKMKIKVNNYYSKISMYLSVYSSIFLLIKEWIKHQLSNKQGEKNASSKLYSKSN